MSKKDAARITELEQEVEHLREDVRIAKRGLFKISNLDSTKYIGRTAPGGLAIVKAFEAAKSAAADALIKLSEGEDARSEAEAA